MEQGKRNDSENVDLPGQEKEGDKPNNDILMPPDGGFQVKIIDV